MKGQPFKKLGGIFRQMLPTVLAGVTGPAAPMILAAAKGVLGDKAGTAGGLVEAVEAALGTPEGREKLKELELAAKKLEAETGIRFAELEVEDRQGARELAIATSMLPQVILSALFICGYFVIVGLFFSATLEVPMSDAFNVLLGVITGSVPTILAFWFGSSKSSQDKTALLGK